MRVQDVMTSPAHSCTPDANLATAALAMKDYDCGALPVLDNAGRPVGILTDRDICLALGFRPLPAAGIPITDVMSKKVYACGPGEEILEALETMRNKKVRRLPVVDAAGQLVGDRGARWHAGGPAVSQASRRAFLRSLATGPSPRTTA